MDTSNTHATQLARKFLDALFPDIPEGLFISLFTLPGEGVSWHASAESASTILDQPSGLNTYFGVALHDRERARAVSTKSRGTAQTSGMIGGLWGDIDIIGPGHAATNLPLNEEEALWLISKMALPPSAIVRSGGGLQPWWFFKEPWVFESDKDRSEAAALAASWIGTMQSHAAYKGWKVDSTKDLARVLRLPGSWNCKIKGDPKFVTVELFDRRYDPGDFREHLEVVVPVRAAKPIAPGMSNTAGMGDKASDADVFVARMCMKSMGSTRAVDRDNWIGVGMALKSMGRQELFLCWDSFSRLCSDKYDEQDTLKTWDSFRPIGTIGLGSLIHWARSDSGQVVGYDDVEIGSAFQHAAKSGRSIEPTATITNGESSSSNGVHPEPAASSEPPSPPSPKPQPEGSFQRIRLANVVDGEYLDKKGKEQEIVYYVDLPQIQLNISQATDGWPRRAGGLLFVESSGNTPKLLPDQYSVQWLSNSDELFAWLGKRCDVRWATGGVVHPVTQEKLNPPSQKVMFEFLQDNAHPVYDGIEALPHVPPVDGLYYLNCTLPGVEDELVTPLVELVSRFNPETEQDRELMLAALLTPGWGGPTGARPPFVFSSDHGRGVGKTITASVLAEIWGGAIGIGANEDWDQVKKRLLGDDSLAKRVCLIDNIKGKFHGGDIESMITAKSLDGWKPYHGQASRPNMMTWYFTANSPSFSSDIANRAVIIKLGKQQHQQDFVRWASEYIPAHRPAILAEIYHRLRSPAKCKITHHDRWGAWQDEILSRVSPEGDVLARLIIERRPGVDSDLDDAEDIARSLKGLLEEHFLDYETRRILVSRQQLQLRLLRDGVIDKSFGPKAVTSWIREKCNSGPLAEVTEKRLKEGRGWLWTGNQWSPSIGPPEDKFDRIYEEANNYQSHE